jgi:hypothetical protein
MQWLAIALQNKAIAALVKLRSYGVTDEQIMELPKLFQTYDNKPNSAQSMN